MRVIGSRAPRLSACALAAVLSGPLAGCMNIGPLTGRATDEWTKTYPLSPGGQLRIANTNGRVEIQGVAGSSVEVRAVRIARAATDTGARELLPRIAIKEDIGPDRVSIETGRLGGFMIGAGFEVQYYVKAPKGAAIDTTTTNGVIALSGLTGKVAARATNGGVTAKELSGGIEARTTNGTVNVEVTRVGADKIALTTVNGGVTLAVPDTAKADLSATCVNGGIIVTGLNLETAEQSRRRVTGKINGGGTPIELRTTNGGIRLRARSESAESEPRTKNPER